MNDLQQMGALLSTIGTLLMVLGCIVLCLLFALI